MGPKHLELLKTDEQFFIKINSLTGRISLFADHPLYKFKQAIDFKSHSHKTGGELSLVPLKTKGMFILEDKDQFGNKAQNFIFASDEISQTLKLHSFSQWLKEHIIDFLSHSISVPFFILFVIYYFLVMRYYNTITTLLVLRYITGVITLFFAVSYYYLRSSKTKSSFLRFCFKFELVSFIIVGTVNNIYHLNNLSSMYDYMPPQ
ncbi:hypothetical protein K2P97_12220 [bacterium]|nr:hypothetical protein [bacterium]